jgi:hypothetical protein
LRPHPVSLCNSAAICVLSVLQASPNLPGTPRWEYVPNSGERVHVLEVPSNFKGSLQDLHAKLRVEMHGGDSQARREIGNT